MDREGLRSLDDALIGNDYPDEVLDAVLPNVQLYLDLIPAIRALELDLVSNALVLPAGGRK